MSYCVEHGNWNPVLSPACPACEADFFVGDAPRADPEERIVLGVSEWPLAIEELRETLRVEERKHVAARPR